MTITTRAMLRFGVITFYFTPYSLIRWSNPMEKYVAVTMLERGGTYLVWLGNLAGVCAEGMESITGYVVNNLHVVTTVRPGLYEISGLCLIKRNLFPKSRKTSGL
jgi:hypothetical protein